MLLFFFKYMYEQLHICIKYIHTLSAQGSSYWEQHLVKSCPRSACGWGRFNGLQNQPLSQTQTWMGISTVRLYSSHYDTWFFFYFAFYWHFPYFSWAWFLLGGGGGGNLHMITEVTQHKKEGKLIVKSSGLLWFIYVRMATDWRGLLPVPVKGKFQGPKLDFSFV